MGMSIDYAVTKWKKEEKTVWVPHIYATWKEEDMTQQERNLFEDYAVALYSYDEIGYCLHEETFHKEDINASIYKHCVIVHTLFMEWLETQPDNPLKTWLMEQTSSRSSENLALFMTYDAILLTDGLEAQQHKAWVPAEYYPLQEDGKLVSMAISSLRSLYGISLSHVSMSQDALNNYEEGTDNGNRIDAFIHRDTAYTAHLLETAIRTMQPDARDDYFEERLPRIKILLEALQHGAKFVYSV